jgi:energy-converting hydrogenase Eha subunit E
MLRAQAGGILLAVGAATVVVGALRAVAQRDRRPPPDRSVALVPTAGGAAIVLSVGIP